MKCFAWDKTNIYPIGNNWIIENATDIVNIMSLSRNCKQQ